MNLVEDHQKIFNVSPSDIPNIPDFALKFLPKHQFRFAGWDTGNAYPGSSFPKLSLPVWQCPIFSDQACAGSQIQAQHAFQRSASF